MKETAVEWFANRISHGGLVSKKQFDELLEKAKEFDKEERQTYKYTEEDLRRAISFGQGMDLWKEEEKIEKFIQSINQFKQQEQ